MGNVQVSEEIDHGIARPAASGAMAKTFIPKSSTPPTLTVKRVLDLVSQSKTNREIAERLHISHATVKRHIENILKKHNLRNRVEAAIFALSVQRCANNDGLVCPLKTWRRKSRDDYRMGRMVDRREDGVVLQVA